MISQDFWQSKFWKACKKLRFIKLLGFFYKKQLETKHRILSAILCPYYSIQIKKLSAKPKAYPFGTVIVSLTSYPARIQSCYYAICSILNQTIVPDKIILTLSTQEFSQKKLPKQFDLLQEKGLEILWVDENLKSHKKYFYVFQRFPRAIIITIDDDILYPKKTIEKLINSYKNFPHAISALCTNKFVPNAKKEFIFSNSINCYDTFILKPRFDLVAIGFAGILYPPSIMPKETYSMENITTCAPLADDIWLKYMELFNNIPVVCASKYQEPIIIANVQDFALNKINGNQGKNDIQQQNIERLFSYFNFNKKIAEDYIT